MSGHIPQKHTDCLCCLRDGTCDDHRGPGGEPRDYSGPHLYEPTEWVQSVVGQQFRGPDWNMNCTRVYKCTGYDPRCGFWMITVDDLGPERFTNISERAVGRTYHKVKSAAD